MNGLYVILALLPGLGIAWWIYQLDRFQREPWRPLLICFLLGILITFPALKLEEWASDLGWDQSSHLGFMLLTAFVVVALNEEVFKFLVLYLYAFRQKAFDDPLDGIVYAIMVGMGFATLENVLYAFRFGLPTTLVRALTAVPAHAVFAVFMGHYVGRAKLEPKGKWSLLAKGVGVSVGLHGLYDFFILQELYEPLMLMGLVSLIVSGYFAFQIIRKQQALAEQEAT